MSLSIGYKIFPTAESAKIRQNPNLIHYEGRLPTFGDRFKDTPAPPKSGNIGDTVGRYDNWVNQQKPKSSTVESGQHHQRQTESVVVTTTSKTVASSARHGSANSNVIHSMVSPDYETVMKDFDQHLNDSANSDRSSEYDVVHDSYDVHHSVESETHNNPGTSGYSANFPSTLQLNR